MQENFKWKNLRDGLYLDLIYCIFCACIWSWTVYRLYRTSAPTLIYGLLIMYSNIIGALLCLFAPSFYLQHHSMISLYLRFCSSICASAIVTAPTSKEIDSGLAFATYLVMYSKVLMMLFSGWIGLKVGFPLHMVEHYHVADHNLSQQPDAVQSGEDRATKLWVTLY
eukprot:jgi/Botrbrau1/8510/Bobra.0029s0014.3